MAEKETAGTGRSGRIMYYREKVLLYKEKVVYCRDRTVTYLKDDIWDVDVDRMPACQRAYYQIIRFVTLVAKGFNEKRCALHAAGLTYFSLLSIIPVLLLMLLLTKPCGMYEWSREKLRVQTDAMIESFFEKPAASSAAQAEAAPEKTAPSAPAQAGAAQAPAAGGKEFGAQARQLRDQILAQIDAKIEEFNFGLMAVVGFLVLAWAVIKLFGQVEASINEIWNVGRNRGLLRKACVYVSSIMVLPLLTALAMSLPLLRVARQAVDATLGATVYTKWVGDVLVGVLTSSSFSFLVSLLFSALALAFVFWALPNRPKWPSRESSAVSLRAALEGGLATAVMLGVSIRLGAALQFGIANSSAAYGSFALIPILIVWINMSWMLLLLGCNMSYAFQCVHSRSRELPGA